MSRGRSVVRHRLTLMTAAVLIARGTTSPQASPWLQEPAAKEQQTVEDAIKDVSTRYRFREVFAVKNVEALPGEIAQSRNAFRETLTMTVDSPKGAPLKSQRTRQLIYSERPALLGQGGRVDAVVRRFETFRFDPAPQGIELDKKKPLEGLTVFAMRAAEGENVLSLVDNRQITDLEHQVATTVFSIMNDSELLPTGALRIGDNWQLSSTAARLLVGRGKIRSSTLNGTLKSVQPKPQDESMVTAVFGINGNVVTDLGTCDLNLEYRFEFSLQAASNEAAVARGAVRDVGNVLAVGGNISRLILAQIEVSDLPGSDGRLKQVFDRKLIFERQVGGRQTPIELPAEPPVATKENSWLVYEDSNNRFRMIHPPVLKPRIEDENSIMFVSTGPAQEFVRLDLDGADIKPEGLRKDLENEWKAEGFDILAVSEDALEDWGDRRVHRIEAALQSPANANKVRSQFDAYVIQYPQNNTTVLAESITFSDRPASFRDSVEEMLKTIELSVTTAPKAPAETAAPTAPGSPAAAPGNAPANPAPAEPKAEKTP